MQLDHTGACTEFTLLYHLMSDLHASVNTHVSEGFDDLENPGQTMSNQTYFLEHVGNYPERVKNLHFIYASVIRAVTLMEKAFVSNNYETGLDSSEC